MTFWKRFLIWCIVACLVPIGIFIYEGGYNVDAMWWVVYVTVIAVVVEVILKVQRRKYE
jgi:hypothetical protein